MITGHCECRKVSFEADGEVNDFSHCHCSQCRRLHGAAYATFAGLSRDGFRYLSGESNLSHYASSSDHDRVFCSNCGSNILVALDDDEDNYYVAMSTIEGSPPLPAGYHIYVGSKAPWHDIHDDLPQYNEDSDI